MTPTAVIVDDDGLARERLKDLLGDAPEVQILGEATDGAQAVRMIDELRPDLVFLDIEMPVYNGLEVAERITHAPVIVFTTAYGHYAAAAFELAAVDYLVKPFGAERFTEALMRALASAERADQPQIRARIRETLDPNAPMERLFLRDKDRIVPVVVGDVIRFEADGDYVDVRIGERGFLVRLRLQDLEDRLGGRFLRIHRSHLVNLDHVKRFEHHDEARLAAVMSDGTRIVASRARSRELRRLAR